MLAGTLSSVYFLGNRMMKVKARNSVKEDAFLLKRVLVF